MAVLIALRGPESGRHFPLHDNAMLGRQADCGVHLSGKQVSRQHARIVQQNDRHFVEDLASSNGTYVNGRRITPHVPEPISEKDLLQIGPYVFVLRESVLPQLVDQPVVVRETLNARTINQALFEHDAVSKLHIVLDIAQQLARTLDLDVLLDKLVERLMTLFPQADRAMVVLCEGDNLTLRALRSRAGRDLSGVPFSRTVVRRALDEGIGLISENVKDDQRFTPSATIASLDLHSIVCVPLIDVEGRRLGVVQVDRLCKGFGFQRDDLQLLTAIGLQVTVVMDNVNLHAEKLREQRLMQDIAVARDIQAGYLPDEIDGFTHPEFEILGRVFPAREVAGDFYDFVRTPSGKLAFFVGDVSGKGMPAALFMVAVRTLCRHLVKEVEHPANLLTRLNVDLAEDNPACQFVTLAHGVYDSATGKLTLTSAGHPPPLLRRRDGRIEPVTMKPGRLLGIADPPPAYHNVNLRLQPGESLLFVTDGFLEARDVKTGSMFSMDRLARVFATLDDAMPLVDLAERARAALASYTGTQEPQDDLTLLLLRRHIVDEATTVLA